MAAHVIVIDTTARSAKIKTVPGKPLTDILEEACTKLGRDASRFGLKHKNKTLDLSRTVMLSGLSPGAKLELVAASRSPSVVSVALQLPESEPDGTARLTDRFPSTTTLWLILRKFESIGSSSRNFTGRSGPLSNEQTSGSGRLYFETPVIIAMNRELASFTDLQKTLAQLGVNSGSILLRLTFKRTDRPLEDAIAEIGQYFKEVEGEEAQGAHAQSAANAKSAPDASREGSASDPHATSASKYLPSPNSQPVSDGAADDVKNIRNTNIGESGLSSEGPSRQASTKPLETVTGPSQRPISIFAPPSSSTPKAALQKEHDNDFEPTLDHVKSHQRYLQANSQNKMLKSDAQLATEAEAQAQKISQVKEVEIKLRFPDQSQVSAPFTNFDTARTLYEHTRGLMRNPHEPISLTFRVEKGRHVVPVDSDVKLIEGLGLIGRVLIDVVWGEGAGVEARKGSTLKEEFRTKAQEIQVPQMQGAGVAEEEKEEKNRETLDPKDKSKGKAERKGGMPKWFKGIGKSAVDTVKPRRE